MRSALCDDSPVISPASSKIDELEAGCARRVVEVETSLMVSPNASRLKGTSLSTLVR